MTQKVAPRSRQSREMLKALEIPEYPGQGGPPGDGSASVLEPGARESRMRPPVPPLCLTLSKRAPNHCLASQALSPWEETLPLGLRGGSQSHSNQSLGLWVVEIHLWAEPTSQDTGQLWMCRRICPEPDGEGAGASQTQAQVPGGRAAGIPRGAALLGLWALSLYGSTGLRIWWCLWAASARLTRGSPEPHATREGGQQEPRTKSSHGDGICVT